MTRENIKLQKTIKDLDSYCGENTELVSVFVSDMNNVQSTIDMLKSEYHQAENIQSKQTRKHVQKAISWVQSELQNASSLTEIEQAAVFAGQSSEKFIKEILIFEEKRFSTNKYHCDNSFYLSPLESLLHSGTEYGIIIIERGKCCIGKATSSGEITEIATVQSSVMGKHTAGGFSQSRFENEIERQKKEFFNTIAQRANNIFISEKTPTIEDLVIGGTFITADEFVKSNVIHHELEKILHGPYKAEYATKSELQTVFNKAKSDLQDVSDSKPVNEFFAKLRESEQRVRYGRTSDYTYLAEIGSIETLLVTEDCLRDTSEALVESIKSNGGDIYVVQENDDRYPQFNEAFQMGAILRFPVN